LLGNGNPAAFAVAVIGHAISRMALRLCRIEFRSPIAGKMFAFTAILALRVYRSALSRFTGRRCQFNPSCSRRALTYLQKLDWNDARLEIASQLGRCDGNYVIISNGERLEMRASDGMVFGEDDIAQFIRKLYQ
jgi:putative component of membrane protein insertase Oxa1/YidC/SpoIIIJ protein YidD